MSSPVVNPMHPDEKHKQPPILIVEDNAVNQTITVNQVAGLGYETAVVQNGQDALDALGSVSDWIQGQPPYRLIFMDCNMPVMDGYQATKEIRRLEAKAMEMYAQERDSAFAPPPIAIVALTANVMATDRVRAFSVGMDDYLTKPVTVSTLKRTIERWLSLTASCEHRAYEHRAKRTEDSHSPNYNEGAINDNAIGHGQDVSSHQTLLAQGSMAPSQRSQLSISQPQDAMFQPAPQHRASKGTDILSNESSMQDPSHLPVSKDDERFTLSHLDWSYLHELSDSDDDFEKTLLELFLEDCQEQLKKLKEAIAQSNLVQIERISHYIKGASANVGAQVMRHYAHQIEQQVRQTQLTCFDTEMNRLETSLSIVQDIFANQRQE